MKRLLDVLVSASLLLLTAPLFPILALLVKRDSKGPVFYRGIRSAMGGGTFLIFKFRTMYVDQTPERTSCLNDPRVTRIGFWLRRFKLDELPQLINVLRGEMSLVGPRPELPRYTDMFRGEEKLILTVKPGITDLSSIQFISIDEVIGSKDVDRVFEEEVLPQKNALRVKYVKERTFWLDLKILTQTFLSLLRHFWRSLEH